MGLQSGGADARPAAGKRATRMVRKIQNTGDHPLQGSRDRSVPRRRHKDRRIAAVLSALESDRARDLQSLAQEVNLSASRLRHLFKKEVGLSLGAYRKHAGLATAAHLLTQTFLSIKQVSAAIGFTDAGHFARDFRNAFATSPTAYRRAATNGTK